MIKEKNEKQYFSVYSRLCYKYKMRTTTLVSRLDCMILQNEKNYFII